MLEVQIKNQNKSWIIVGVNFLILGLIFLVLSYNVNQDEWFFHGIFFVLSSLIISKQFLKLIYLPKEILFFDLRWIFLFSFWVYFVLGLGDRDLWGSLSQPCTTTLGVVYMDDYSSMEAPNLSCACSKRWKEKEKCSKRIS